ncbi:MAG: DUF4870 domain-containing protein [Candidatus Omnitrophota bacterium]
MDKIQENETRVWAMFCHLSALAMLIGIPFGNVLGPLIVWLCKKNEIPAVEQEGKKALNFQISMTVYIFVLGVSAFLLIFIFIGYFLIPVLFLALIADFILTIIAAVKISNGESFEYPMVIKFIR